MRHVGGIENCFVSLPFQLLQTLESTRPGGILPQVLTLELRSPSINNQWVVAWSGATSSSFAIEVLPPSLHFLNFISWFFTFGSDFNVFCI